MRFSAYPLDQQMCKFLVSLVVISKCLTDIDTRNDFHLIHISALRSINSQSTADGLGSILSLQLPVSSNFQRAQLGLAPYQPSSRGGMSNTLERFGCEEN